MLRPDRTWLGEADGDLPMLKITSLVFQLGSLLFVILLWLAQQSGTTAVVALPN
jgi:hypothetical protein